MEDKAKYGEEIEGTWVRESTIDLTKLKEVFPPEDIEWRVQRSGKKQDGSVWAMVLAYITNRAIMERLDEVCGAGNWKNDFRAAPNGGTLCELSIKVNDEWVTKCDGAENTDIESVKGGLSSAMKRAGVQWGIGRYLYRLTTGWAVMKSNGTHNDKLKDGTWFKWDPPQLPSWALPSGTTPPTKPEPPPEKPTNAPQATQAPPKGKVTQKQLSTVYDLLSELEVPIQCLVDWLVSKGMLKGDNLKSLEEKTAQRMIDKWSDKDKPVSVQVNMYYLNNKSKYGG